GPVERGRTRSTKDDPIANVIFDPKDFTGLVSSRFSGAVVMWEGKFPAGTYAIVLEGRGGGDLWILGRGLFGGGVREGTAGRPARARGVSAVGATVNHRTWRAVGGETLRLVEGRVEDPGGLTVTPLGALIAGPVAPFSGAGPGLGGEPKPDVLAPGVAV